MTIPRRLHTYIFALTLILGGMCAHASVASAYDFGTLPIGTSSTKDFEITFPRAGILTEELIVTQGRVQQDFTRDSRSTCWPGIMYQAGETCVIQVDFAPAYAGLRLGAITLGLDSGPLPPILLHGRGYEPQLELPGPMLVAFAGNYTAAFGEDGQPAKSQPLNWPTSAVGLPDGTFLIADFGNNRIRSVDITGTISTIAGTGLSGFSGDGGPATTAVLNGPVSLAVDGLGAIYFLDYFNHRLRRIDPNGTISTVAGTGTGGYNGDGMAAAAAELDYPSGLALDGDGDIFIADSGNNRIRMIDASGIISTVAGSGSYGFSGDGGQATSAALGNPSGLAVDYSGSLYIADTDNNRIRVVNGLGVISTFAGTGTAAYSGDGDAATAASLDGPSGIAIDVDENVLIADEYNNVIRKVDISGNICTLVNTSLTDTLFFYPMNIGISNDGALLIPDIANSVTWYLRTDIN